MKIASWNVNSIKQRLPHVLDWLAAHKPDILMLQELKGLEYPANEIEKAGYTSIFAPQKARNGVAIISLKPATLILDKLPGDETDEEARYLEADIQGIRIINIYAPNGNPVDSDKFLYKLFWLDRLISRLKILRAERIPFVIGGDFNIIPEDRDCYAPAVWRDDALFRPESVSRFRTMCNLGLTDALRAFNDEDEQYTFWDYQAGAWPANKGIRIDHFLLSPPLADRLTHCFIDRHPRGLEKPSDHTAVVIKLENPG